MTDAQAWRHPGGPAHWHAARKHNVPAASFLWGVELEKISSPQAECASDGKERDAALEQISNLEKRLADSEAAKGEAE